VEFAVAGKNAVMPAIRRLSDSPYRWDIIEVPLSEVANQEKLLPLGFISVDGFGITAAARRYLAPLIVGEAYPPFKDGLPDYVRLQNGFDAEETDEKFCRMTDVLPHKLAVSSQSSKRSSNSQRSNRHRPRLQCLECVSLSASRETARVRQCQWVCPAGAGRLWQ
jgi:hypothetical protein